MDNREKVINGLDCCLEGLCDLCKYCNSDGPSGCRDELMLDAFLLLEAQLPRVMTLEEVKALKQDTVVWYEHAGVHPPRPRVVHYANDEHIVFSDGGDFRYGADGYGKHFRLWTFCPTDAQREATPWEK